MNNVLNKSYSQLSLRATINGFALESRKLRLKANKYKDADMRSTMNSYRWITSDNIRMHLLAYAFLRGKAYKDVERTCAENNVMEADRLLHVINLFSPNYVPYDKYTKTGGNTFKITLEDVKAWLGQGDSDA